MHLVRVCTISFQTPHLFLQLQNIVMKKIAILSIAVFFYQSLFAQTSSQQVKEEFKKLSWLEGTWVRTNAKPGRSGHERWIKLSEYEWQGFGISMRGSDTSFVEKLNLLIKDDHIYYIADVPGNKEPVYFKLTQVSTTGFICENPEHDFPKKIEYNLDGKKLQAIISGNGNSKEYLFNKE